MKKIKPSRITTTYQPPQQQTLTSPASRSTSGTEINGSCPPLLRQVEITINQNEVELKRITTTCQNATALTGTSSKQTLRSTCCTRGACALLPAHNASINTRDEQCRHNLSHKANGKDSFTIATTKRAFKPRPAGLLLSCTFRWKQAKAEAPARRQKDT